MTQGLTLLILREGDQMGQAKKAEQKRIEDEQAAWAAVCRSDRRRFALEVGNRRSDKSRQVG